MPSLKELLLELPDARVEGDINAEVMAIAYDSREVSPGSAFVAIRGFARDGHEYIASAIERGASVIVADNADSLQNLRLKSSEYSCPIRATLWRCWPANFTVILRAN